MDRLLAVAFPFFAPIFIGYLAGRFSRRSGEALVWLNVFVIYVALPPVFFQLISKTPIEQLANGAFIASTTLASYLAFAIAFAAAYALLGGRAREAVVAGGIGGYGNVGYMGPGLALAVLGPEVAAPMALVFTFDCILFFAIIPILLAVNEGAAGLGRTLITVVRRVVLSPFLIAIALGVLAAAYGIRAPEPVDRTLNLLMAAAAPSALFALGVTVAMRPLKPVPRELWAALAVKLVAHPVLVLLILSAVGSFPALWVHTAILLAALPPALSVFVMAAQYKVYEENASTGVLVGTALGVPSLVFWLFLIKEGWLPRDLFP